MSTQTNSKSLASYVGCKRKLQRSQFAWRKARRRLAATCLFGVLLCLGAALCQQQSMFAADSQQGAFLRPELNVRNPPNFNAPSQQRQQPSEEAISQLLNYVNWHKQQQQQKQLAINSNKPQAQGFAQQMPSQSNAGGVPASRVQNAPGQQQPPPLQPRPQQLQPGVNQAVQNNPLNNQQSPLNSQRLAVSGQQAAASVPFVQLGGGRQNRAPVPLNSLAIASQQQSPLSGQSFPQRYFETLMSQVANSNRRQEQQQASSTLQQSVNLNLPVSGNSAQPMFQNNPMTNGQQSMVTKLPQQGFSAATSTTQQSTTKLSQPISTTVKSFLIDTMQPSGQLFVPTNSAGRWSKQPPTYTQPPPTSKASEDDSPAPELLTTQLSTTSNAKPMSEFQPTSLPPATTALSPFKFPQTTVQNLPTTQKPLESDWNPVEKTDLLRLATNKTQRISTLMPSLDIVTISPDYNPDAPVTKDHYDINVSVQLGSAGKSPQQRPTRIQSEQLATTPTSVSISVAPTAVTTITWTPPSLQTAQPSNIDLTIENNEPPTTFTQPPTASTKVPNSHIMPTNLVSEPPVELTSTLTSTTLTLETPNKDKQANIDVQSQSKSHNKESRLDEESVVYGRSGHTQILKPVPPSQTRSNANAMNPATVNSSLLNETSNQVSSQSGKSFVRPAELESGIKPFAGSKPGDVPLQTMRSNHGSSASPSVSSETAETLPPDIQKFFSRQRPPASSGGPGDTLTGMFKVSDSAPTISSIGEMNDPLDNSSIVKSVDEKLSTNSTGQQIHTSLHANKHQSVPSQSQPKIRRPTFKPKPAIPPIRIDSCIVGDDSSCDQSHNERCITEYGISSCHCRPGFARLSQLRGYCSPINSLMFSMKIDKLSDNRKLAFNSSLVDTNSEEYQYLEFETIQAVFGAFQAIPDLSKYFMGAKVNKFFSAKNKVWANVTINLESNNVTKSTTIQTVAMQELLKVVSNKQSSHSSFGDSTIQLDSSRDSMSKLVDVNECASKDLNDCSKHASCINEFGSFKCECNPGFEDKYLSTTEDTSKHGRVCLGCSPAYCSNKGECSIFEGKKQCRCRPNFFGARCDIDFELLFVIVGGILIGVLMLLITCWCFYIFNRRLRREQQKMDAISATSGLTYNYINSSSNNLVSPSGNHYINGLQRSGNTYQLDNGQIRSSNNRRAGHGLIAHVDKELGNLKIGATNYFSAPDQQAMIGSTSSNSSADSCQAYAYNPYATNYADSGLLLGPASSSSNSSDQISPAQRSYRDPNNCLNTMQSQAYTLSGYHHHHHHHSHQQQLAAAAAAAQHQQMASVAAYNQAAAAYIRSQQSQAAKMNEFIAVLN